MAAARTVWAMAADKDDDGRRLFLPVKNNLGPSLKGLAYRIVPKGTSAIIEWETGPVDLSADEALGVHAGHEHGTALQEAVDWLRYTLAEGPLSAKEAKGRANAAGIALRTLDRAKAELKVKAGPAGFGGEWLWRLPDFGTVRQEQPENANASLLAHSGENGALCDPADEWGEV